MMFTNTVKTLNPKNHQPRFHLSAHGEVGNIILNENNFIKYIPKE